MKVEEKGKGQQLRKRRNTDKEGKEEEKRKEKYRLHEKNEKKSCVINEIREKKE